MEKANFLTSLIVNRLKSLSRVCSEIVDRRLGGVACMLSCVGGSWTRLPGTGLRFGDLESMSPVDVGCFSVKYENVWYTSVRFGFQG